MIGVETMTLDDVRDITAITRSLAEGRDAGGELHLICELLRSRVEHYDWVGFYLAVPSQRLLALGPFTGAPTEHLKIPYGIGICGQAASTLARFAVSDVTAEANYLACSTQTKAEIVLPLFLNGEFVGELDIDSHTRDPFTRLDDELLGAVADITAPLVEAILPER